MIRIREWKISEREYRWDQNENQYMILRNCKYFNCIVLVFQRKSFDANQDVIFDLEDQNFYQ